MSLHRQRPPEHRTMMTEIVSETDRDKHILLQMLDLHSQKVSPTDLTSMLYISCPWLEDKLPANPTELSNAFLCRLWLYHPQCRSSSCDVVAGAYGVARPPDMDETSQSAINPSDLVAAVYMTSNSFLQQEITYRMVRCHFAVPLFLPPVYPDKNGTVLLWPFRGVLGKWKSTFMEESESYTMKNMASSRMPFLSAVRLGQCSVSKSRVLNSVLGGSHKLNDCFINRDMDGGQLPRIFSDGLVEVTWNLPSADHHSSSFSRPVLMANLRGDAADFDKQVSLLCYTSALLIVFCGYFGTKERQLLMSWRDNASHLILIDCSGAMEEDDEENRNEKMKQIILKDLELSEQFVIDARDADEETLATKLRDALNTLLPHMHSTSLVATAGTAGDLNMNVDEDNTCRMAFGEVEEVLDGIEDGVSQFLGEQLPLQGPTWKTLCQLEKEEGRRKDHRNENLHWQQENLEQTGGKEELLEELMNYKLTAGMQSFIQSLCTYDMTKRAFFLSWMKVKLQVMQLDKLSDREGEQQEPYIGLEHFLREMGLVYERYFRSPNYDLYEMFRLPHVAAELLLCGVPLELFDGDTSVFPLNWINSVLFEVYRQLPQYSRMRVLTTLGFHNSKNAEILSALFGVNFAKSCQHHIRGAYMLFVCLPDNIRKEVDCEFLMLIVTEGLNPPRSAQQEESFVHDNELATFVSQLSDVTLVNLPQGGLIETRQNLQIAINAFLRTKDSERRPTFRVVSEGPIKDAKIMGCVVEILTPEQSTREAETEIHHDKVRGVCENLVGPWTNVSLFNESNQIYSDAALELKQNLLGVFREKALTGQPTCLGAFMEHMCNAWESVKNQNFEIGFGDKHVADALIGLCTKLVDGEQELTDLMHHWVQDLDTRISELKESAAQNGNDGEDPDDIHRILGAEATMQINSESEKIKSGLWEYLRQEDINVNLMETYRPNLLRKVHSTDQQVTLDTNSEIQSALIRHNLSTKIQSLLTALEAALEVKIRSLLDSCKNNDSVIEDKQLQQEFSSVWNDIPSNLDLTTHETQGIHTSMVEQLKENLNSRGLKKQRIKLKTTNQLRGFKVKNRHFALGSKMKRTLKHNKEVAQRFTDNLIEDCNRRVSEKLRHKEGYSDSYMRELLAIVDKGLEVLTMEPFVMKRKFEVDLKVHICSKAAESFQQMYNALNHERDTKQKFLNETKERHFQSFMYSFRKRDQCQKAAWTFTNSCLRPIALDFVYNSLERQILDDMLASDYLQVYVSPRNFHYHLLRELLLENKFEKFLEYLQSPESIFRKKIENVVVERLSGSVMIEDCRELRIRQIFERMEKAIDLASENSSEATCNVRLLLQRVCAVLKSPGDVTVPPDVTAGPLFDVSTQQEHFVTQLKESLAELSSSITQEFSENVDVIEVPDDLSIKLQNLLYDHVKGCDKCCPFCKSPCDLGGVEHTAHEAFVHRPKGVVSYTIAGSSSLSHLTCSADMAGENQFQNRDTGGQPVLYRNYQSIYTDWNISPERLEKYGSGAYWKYVLFRYNSKFAQVYQCEPASLPEDWKQITQEEALRSLKEAFHITW
ncbi:interferon-induced very large GTPase 1 [Brachyhypopomus gauderio]|uniref:interferon-induced very large GTPase 1 n=1 Tax=Brachyhypopomus gauderio TaxID=698409 RepID=UPI004041E66A